MFFEFINRKLKRNALDYSCLSIVGDRGSGKSSVMALIADEALKQGRQVYCQYPYKDTYKIPMCRKNLKFGLSIYDVDRNWLYNNAFEPGSVILLDEASTIWPARNFKNWSEADSAFFNFIRKEKITLVIATQYYDQLDLNVKRSADETWFISRSLIFPNISSVEASITMTVKVADKNTEVVGKAFKRGARKIAFDVCEIPKRTYHFYRKPYYGKFITDFVPFLKNQIPVPSWNELDIFNNE